jgi:hypothetical protein
VIADEIAKLKARVESLQGLLIRAYAKFLFFRPMMVNNQLNERISTEERGAGFSQLRNWLYWDFIQELVKLCNDPDNRTPSIRQLNKALVEPIILASLKEQYSQRTWPVMREEDLQIAQHFQKKEEEELRLEFDETYRRFQDNSTKLLSSDALNGYVTIRNKLIAHNELQKTADGYDFFDVRVLKLKYGQERRTLEMARDVVDDLDLLVRNSSFAWDSFLEQETTDVCKFWNIEAMEEPLTDAQSTVKPNNP